LAVCGTSTAQRTASTTLANSTSNPQQTMPERNTGITADNHIELRIGINLGDVKVRDRLPFVFEDPGAQQVKNIARPVRVYRVSAAAIVDRAPGDHRQWRRTPRRHRLRPREDAPIGSLR
jgi:class 3 adenylate cyclase